MTRKERYEGIIEYFSEKMPNPETELNYNNPYELIVAVILSAQCTDKRVNIITPDLFMQYPNAKALSKAEPEEVFEYIGSCSYPNNKSKQLVGMARKLLEEFDGEIPDTIPQLIKLPGVGRKTANVVASVIHNKPTMAVDTHVFRVSHRIGLVPLTAKTPLAVEKALVKNFSEEIIPKAHHWLILHGRYVCTARSPKCETCEIFDFCKSGKKILKVGAAEVDKKLPKIS